MNGECIIGLSKRQVKLKFRSTQPSQCVCARQYCMKAIEAARVTGPNVSELENCVLVVIVYLSIVVWPELRAAQMYV